MSEMLKSMQSELKRRRDDALRLTTDTKDVITKGREAQELLDEANSAVNRLEHAIKAMEASGEK